MFLCSDAAAQITGSNIPWMAAGPPIEDANHGHRKNKAKISPAQKMVNLALQGGGAHGAFTWGVLDRLLEDGRIGVEAISGTSAGAVNSVALVDGFMRGGHDGAREALHKLWEEIAHIGAFSPIQRSPLDIWQGNFSLDHNPAYLFFDMP